LLVVQLAGTAVLRAVAGGRFHLESILLGGLHGLLQTILQFYFVAVLLYALLSWFGGGGYNPATQILAKLVEPLLAPIRRSCRRWADSTSRRLFLLIALQALQILLR
jgi:uncharacterized protein YggT (Ycf19 family)